jgi:hypothetical protein
MKLVLGLLVSLFCFQSSLYAASSPAKIVCRGESVLQSDTYYGYIKTTDRIDKRLMITFEKYSVSGVADTADSKCGFYTANCSTCKTVKRDFNKLAYRPAEASATVLCAAGSSVVEYRSINSFVNDTHSFKLFPGLSVNGVAVREDYSLSDPSCVSWAE